MADNAPPVVTLTCSGCGEWNGSGHRSRCPKCLVIGISTVAFCSKACFKSVWADHKERYHHDGGILLAASEAYNAEPGHSILLSLPEETLVHILSFLPLVEVARLREVCKTLSRVAADSHVWRHSMAAWAAVSSGLTAAAASRAQRTAALTEALNTAAELLEVKEVLVRHGRGHFHLACLAVAALSRDLQRFGNNWRKQNIIPDPLLSIVISPYDFELTTNGEMMLPYMAKRVRWRERSEWLRYEYQVERATDEWIAFEGFRYPGEFTAEAMGKTLIEVWHEHALHPCREVKIGRNLSPTPCDVEGSAKTAKLWELPAGLIKLLSIQLRPWDDEGGTWIGKWTTVSRRYDHEGNFVPVFGRICVAATRFLGDPGSSCHDLHNILRSEQPIFAAIGDINLDVLERTVSSAIGVPIAQRVNGIWYALALTTANRAFDLLRRLFRGTGLTIVIVAGADPFLEEAERIVDIEISMNDGKAMLPWYFSAADVVAALQDDDVVGNVVLDA